MQAKKIGCFLSILLLFSALMGSVHAEPTTVQFHSVGVTIDLSFPEEAHPDDNIWHNATLTANSPLTLYNLTLVIKAPVDSTWQEATAWFLLNRVLQANESRIEEMNFQLPSNANGTLQCYIYVSTNQSTDYLSTTFYTTRVSELTFSEMQSLYNEMLANYTSLVEDYDGLLANYSSLLTEYATLLSQNTSLSQKYANSLSTYATLLSDFNTLSTEHGTLDSRYTALSKQYTALQSDYDSLNSTRNNIQGNYTVLDAAYKALNQTYVRLTEELSQLNAKITQSDNNLGTDRILMFVFVAAIAGLIGFIIYLKRKQAEPYVVIRKETVAVKQDEKPKE